MNFKLHSFLVSGLLMCSMVQGATVLKTENGVVISGLEKNNDATAPSVAVDFYTSSIVRIKKIPTETEPELLNLVVTAQPENVKFTLKESADKATLKSDKLIVEINKNNGQVTFLSTDGKALLAENGAAQFKAIDDAGRPSYTVKQSFSIEDGETVYGLGISQRETMTRNNTSYNLTQGNQDDASPVLQSIKGWGIFWDNYSPTRYSQKETDLSFDSQVGDAADYYFIYGGNADGVVAGIRHLSGKVPMIPLWAYGFMQSRERYKTDQEPVEVLSRHRELQVPIDVIIQDWQYWGNNYLWNAMEFNSPDFSNARGMLDRIHAMNGKMMISIWSSFGPMTKQYRELQPKGLLIDFSTWPQSGLTDWPPRRDYPSGVRPYDPFSQEARDIYWKHLTRLFDFGLDGWWMDSTEPDHLDYKESDMDLPTAMGSFRRVCNAYPLMAVGGVYQNQRAVSGDKRLLILTRSCFTGQQRYGSNTWSGDITTSWSCLRSQIAAGLNFTLTGNPNYNSDGGGFFISGYKNGAPRGLAAQNPAYQEIYVRWIQQAVFNPMMRSHGADSPREIYYFGEKGTPVFDAIESAIRLRYALLPYIYSTAWQVSKNDYSFMRPLMMDFAEDSNVWNIGQEYMFGQNLLVAPVCNYQYTFDRAAMYRDSVDFTKTGKKDIYLPAGTTWYDYFSSKTFKGGQTIDYTTHFDQIPLFVRAGAILPIGPDVQYSTEKSWDELEIRIFPGADGTFVLYEDEFDNYNYENGAYTEIPMTWNDKSRTLTIGNRTGKYDGMISTRKFRIVSPEGREKTVTYTGKALKVKM